MTSRIVQELKELPLNTVEDAQVFFATVENARHQGIAFSQISHLFFGRVDSGLKFDPYNIRTVCRDNRPQNYFVVTKDYIVRVNRREAEYECVATVQEWVREAKCFAEICKINFFRCYLRHKTLLRLLSAVRRVKVQRNRALLAKRLLLCTTAFQSDIMEVRARVAELQCHAEGKACIKVSSVQTAADKPQAIGYSIDEFSANQEIYGKKLARYMADNSQGILAIVARRSEAATVLVNGLKLVQKLPETTGSVNKEVTAKMLRQFQMEQKRLVVNYENIPALIRLAHHLQLEAVFQQACTTFCDLEVNLRKRRLCTLWNFRVECFIGGDRQLTLAPEKDSLLEAVSAVLSGALNSLANTPTCADDERLCSSIPRGDAITVRRALFSDELIGVYRENALRRIEADYDDAKSKLNSYESLTMVSTFLNDWRDVACRWQHILLSGEPVFEKLTEQEIRSYATRTFKSQMELEKLTTRSFGTVTVSCGDMLHKLTTELKMVLSTIDELVQQVIQSNYGTLKATSSTWVAKLRLPALKVEPFVKWYLNLQECGAVYDAFANHVADLQSFYRLQAELREKASLPPPAEEPDLVASLRDPFQDSAKAAQDFHAANFGRVKDLLHEEYNAAINTLHITERRLASTYSDESANEVDSPALEKLEDVHSMLSVMRRDAKQLDSFALILDVEPFDWSEIAVAEDDLRNYVELWNIHREAAQLRNLLDSKAVESLNGQDLENSIVSLFQRAFKAQRSTPGTTAERLVEFLAVEKAKLPTYVELCNPALTEEHWAELFKGASIPPLPPARRTLRALERTGLMNEENAAMLRAVVSRAVGVYELDRQLAKLEQYWASHAFTVVPYAGRSNAFVVDAIDETLETLEEQQITVQTCLSSKYVATVQPKLVEWEAKLNLIHSVLEEWVCAQKAWVYLEFIFTSDDIKRQLPDESLLFTSADRFFGSLMRRCVEDPRMAPLCLDADGRTLKKLQKCTHQLECIQKKIDDYLETKRVAFPRFYFLSNDELLSILSDSRNPLAVQPHLQKCFDNIKSLVFADAKTIVAMRSSEGEEVAFTNPVKVIGNVESWLNDVEQAMRTTLADRLALCLRTYSPAKRTTWVFDHPAQCVTTVDQIVWTSDVEGVIAGTGDGSASAWMQYQARFSAQLLETVELVKRPLTALQRTVVCNLIVVGVHCRDVCAELACAGCEVHAQQPTSQVCSSVLDFGWQKQLRFYYSGTPAGASASGGNSNADCVVRHGAAELPYGYEYLGNQARLVITPLTERAFLTCTAALHMQKGAAPQGPAGTGKTESVKDLGKALARTVVVFNCSDGLDYRMMSQMFAGLAQAGAWACFDEFNRIDLEVLSVIAQQMLDITTAITQKQTSIDFEGHRIKLHPNFGVFVTMNPGYAGRTELPDNLKALFRPVCMMIPNYALIAEIMFYAEGYSKAQVLAAKMIRLYSLASQQLSKQDHYDFGMRAVKSILVLAGRLKRADPDAEEELLLVRAIREANLPKFLADDRHLFLALLHDFFPAFTQVAAAPVGELVRGEAVRVLAAQPVQCHACAMSTPLQLQATEGLLFKIQQLFDTLMTRHGLMLVGRAMTGKTTVRNTLAAVLARLGALLDRTTDKQTAANSHGDARAGSAGAASRHSTPRSGASSSARADPQPQSSTVAALRCLDARCQPYFTATRSIELNPKAVSMTELYGDVNPLTREWQDGVFSSIVRELVKAGAAEKDVRVATRHWVVFDGPVDAAWVENLNTVLDDSKMLCLVNGERIRIPDTISLLFEVQDLRVASPATVSRCGMVYVDEECVDDGWTPVLRSRSQAAAAELGSRWRHDRFMQLCQTTLPALFRVVREECKEYIGTSNVQLGLNLFYLLKAGVQQLCVMIAEDRQEQQQEEEEAVAASSVMRARGPRGSLSGAAGATDTSTAARRYSRRRSSLAARTSVLLLGDSLFDALFVQSCAWGVGGNLTEATRARFASAMLPLVRQASLYFPASAETEQRGVFDYAVDLDAGDWRRWGEMVPPFQYNAAAPYFDLLVPTEQTVALQYLLKSATTTRHHLLLNGLTGTGKSSTVNSYLLQVLHTEEAASATAAFRFTLSAQTSAHALQSTIEMKLARRKGDREFGAPPGKQTVIAVIDDCNVPQLEEYGAAPPIELLRQMITQGGFYDRKKLFFKAVVQTVLIACCGEPGGGKNEMTSRFTSKLLCFCAPHLTPSSMKSIFSAILGGFFRTHGFAAAVCDAVDAAVDSTLEAYRRIAVECLPTPDKTHCTFNLRDVSKVFQGILQVKPAHCSTPVALMQLWSHEASRVFHDRLVDDADRGWWWRCCAEVAAAHFHDCLEPNVDADSDAAAATTTVVADLARQLPTILYGSWTGSGKRDYQRIDQETDLQAAAQQHLAEYNAQSATPMNLVFFDEAVQHLSRLCRIVSQPRGHALLVGVGGSGRASLCRLAAFIMNMDVQTVHIARNYGINDFRDEVRKALLDCGVHGREVVFLVSDPQLVCGEMLEDINNLLNAGEVPGMMGLEEMEVIMRSCSEACVATGRPDSRSSVYGYFVSQCCERFHLCLCMSPMSGVFRDRLRMFPALVNCTTIDWFSEWPQTALLAVAQATLRDSANPQQPPSTAKLDALMVHLQASVKEAATHLFEQRRRRTHVTPTSYLAVLALFNATAQQLRHDLQTNAQRYRNGLEKLDHANVRIAQLQQQLREMQPGLTAAAEQVAAQKRSLAVEQQDADVLREAQSKEEAAAKALMQEAESIRRECEEGLQQALPALEAAKQALQTLSAKDIQEIKTFATPPSNVEKTMNAVLLLLGEKDGWANAKVCLGKMDFISRLTDYPRDSITPACIRKLATFVQDPEFVPDVIEKTSLPCRSMCMWVHAVYRYYFVAKEVAPKRARLAAAETKVAAARTELEAKQAALQQVLDRIAQLQTATAAAQAKADHFQREIETAQGRLTRADQLITGLASERGRWEAALTKLEIQLGCVEGTAALAAGCIGYLGPFPLDYREALLSRWRAQCTALGIAFDATYALATMEPDATVQQWSLHSLPRDTYSIQNATILHRSTQCCYMIDPQGQANTFVRTLEQSRGHSSASAGLLQLKLSSPDLMRQIENAVRKGQAVLLEDVGETLDAALDPILLNQVRRVAGRSVVTLGDREVTYDERFRLYMTTKLMNPVLTPELQVKLTVIDFTVTREGLAEQLLADIVGSERASLQQRGDRCVVSIAAHREKIAALEAQVLQQLSDATGDVLDNVELIRALQTSKATSDKIAVELAAVEETNATINAARDLYRPLAMRGSLLYSAIAQMAKVDPMYEYSLPFFKDLVVSVMKSTRRAPSNAAGGPALPPPPPPPPPSSSSSSLLSGTFQREEEGEETTRSRRPSVLLDFEKCAAAFASGERSSGDGVAGEAALSEEEVRDRVAMLVEEVTWTSYRVLCRGLFGAHKLLFSFVLATTLLRSTGAVTEAEWRLFLRGCADGTSPAALSTAGEASRRPAYVSIDTWANFGALCTLDPFAEVRDSFLESLSSAPTAEEAATTTATAEAAGDGPLPWPVWLVSTWGVEVLSRMPAPLARLSLWHRVMAIKVLRPSKLPYIAAELVADTLGHRYTVAPPCHLQEVFADSTKMTPIILILSPGVDPTSLFLDFAEERGFSSRKYMLSLGQDQGVRAAQMVRDGQHEGAWVYLQNCHVYASWMPQLQALVEAMNPTEIHDDFRLWLTSSPSPSFPAVVLQAGLKLTQEPPMGLRGKVLSILQSTVVADVWACAAADAAANAMASTASFPQWADSATATAQSAPANTATPPVVLQRLVWTLAFFHGTVMERRRFSPLGWNVAYDWGLPDFAAGVATVRTALSRSNGSRDAAAVRLPTEELCYMLGVIDYGGRVTDEWDTRCLQVLTRRYFGETATVAAPSDPLAPPDFPSEGLTYAEMLRLAETTLADGANRQADNQGSTTCLTTPAAAAAAGAAESPTHFGLHDNATLAVEQQLSFNLVDALVAMNAGGGGTVASTLTPPAAAGEALQLLQHDSTEAENPMAALARRLLAQLPPPLPHCDPVVSAPAPTCGTAVTTALADPAPLQTLLAHETDLYNRLLDTMRGTLTELLQALKGEVVVTARLERLMQRLAFSQVPELWSQVGYLTLKPLGSFMEDLLCRVHFMRRWSESGLPPSFWLSGVFFPQGFVMALLQARSRALRVPIDSLQLRFRVLTPEEGARVTAANTAYMAGGEARTMRSAVVGAYVHGLYLEGCGWDHRRGGLIEAAPGALTTELPVIHFEPVTAEEAAPPPSRRGASGGDAYVCPLYEVRTRAGTLSTTGISTNYVTSLTLPSLNGVTGDHWTLRGVAALCALDD
ncbi:dynein heavy chain cytosolic putative [Lotmaria passim]